MITEVTKYVVDSGEAFDTLEEAQRYERNSEIEYAVARILFSSDDLCYGMAECEDIAAVIMKHYDVKKI